MGPSLPLQCIDLAGNSTRRRLVVALGAGVLVSPFALFAQQPGKVWRVGFFYFGSRKSAMETGRYQQFLEGMRELGYEEGRNLLIESRFAEGNAARLPDIAAEFARLKVDVIVATGAPVYHALQVAGSNIPTAVTVASDPIRAGFAKTLARPGGNFTGLSENNAELVTKQFELMRLAVPGLSRIAVLTNPTNPAESDSQLKKVQAVAQPLRIKVAHAESSTSEGNERAFAAIAGERSQGVIILNDTFFVQQSRQIADLAIKHRLPSIFGTQDYARAGGLMSYGPEIAENFRRVAVYVDKILKGAKPGDLPMEQPTRYAFTINRQTAKALGLNVSNELQLRADKVIE